MTPPLRYGLGVVAAFAVLAAVAGVWLAVDRHPPEWDHANHLQRVVECARDVAGGDLAAVLERSAFYPPLVPCVAAAVYRVLPSDAAAAQAVMIGFLALGMAMVYLVGRERLGARAGMIAAVIFGSAPFVVFNTVRFQLDLPLAAVVALALWLTLRTEGFSRRGWSLAVGVVAGIGLLTKPPFPVYVLPALAWALAGRGRSGRLVNASLAVAAAAIVSLAWYGPRLMGLPAQIGNRSFKQAAESGHPPALSWAGLSIYPVTLSTFFGAAATVLFAAGLVVAVRRRRWFELVTVLAPFAVFLAIQNKNARYTLPLLPMASIVAALALETVRPRARAVVLAATLAIAVVQVSATAFAWPPLPTIPGTRVAAAIPAPPSGADWGHRVLLDAIARHAGGPGVSAVVSVVPNHEHFSASNFRYYAARDGRAVRIARAWDDPPVGIQYMILKTGDVGPPWTEGKSRRAMERLRDDPDMAAVFPVIAEVPLPDGSVATVRARDMGPGVDADATALAQALDRAARRGLDDVARDVVALEVHLDYDEAAIVRGRVRRVQLRARRASVGELRKKDAATLTVGDLRIVADDVLVNPFTLAHTGRVELLDARLIRLEGATITADDFQAFVSGLKGLRHTRVRLEPDALAFAMELLGPDVSGRVRVRAAPGRPFVLDADGVRVGGVAVPGALVHWVFRNLDPSARLASRLPVPVELATVRVGADAIRITDR